MNRVNPKKLLLSKWAAATTQAKQKYCLVGRVIPPKLPTDPVDSVEIAEVFSKGVRVSA